MLRKWREVTGMHQPTGEDDDDDGQRWCQEGKLEGYQISDLQKSLSQKGLLKLHEIAI